MFFTCCKNSRNYGMLALARSGALYAVVIDESALVPYLMNNCGFLPNNQALAVELATRYRLPAIENLFQEQFSKLIVDSMAKDGLV